MVLDFGELPQDELATLARCSQRFDLPLQAWVPTRDRVLRTTIPGIFAVGIGAGVASSLVAEEEGRIAGITAAEEAGLLSRTAAESRRAEVFARLDRLVEARRAIEGPSRIRPGLWSLADSTTVLCPCEGVTLGAVEAALASGPADLSTVKLATRLGMGPCQARRCGASSAAIVCEKSGRTPAEVGRINARPPARPVTLGALARMDVPAGSTPIDAQDAIGGRDL